MFWRSWRRQESPDGLGKRALVALIAAQLGRKPSDAELAEDVVGELERRVGASTENRQLPPRGAW